MTRRLYYDDPLLSRFTARVLAHAEHHSLVLDQTALYPESGGQMADHGTLFFLGARGEVGARVEDVQVDDAGVVHHVLEGELPPVGVEVRGQVDLARRRAHMALHSGQHVLSRALVDVARAETVSSRLGETLCTIDVDVPGLAESAVGRAEALANELVDADRPVRTWFPEPGELATLPLRRAPKQSEHVRVVDLGGFDLSPCGGTHVTHTAQIGVVRVLGTERYKGGTRVSFEAGPRARRALAAEADALRALAKELTCGALAVADAVAKLRADLGHTRDALSRAHALVAEHTAHELAAHAVPGAPIVAVLDAGGAELARTVAARLVREGTSLAAIGARDGDGLHVVLARSDAGATDCGALFKRLALATGGRGGGRPERAEGKLPADVNLVDAIAAAHGG